MSAGPVAREALDFQQDLDGLIAAPVPLFLRAWPAIGAGLIAALLVVAALTRLDVVVSASGRLTAEVPPVVLQPVGSAVLRELRVQPGDAVRTGDVLAVIDSTFTAADRASLQSQARALTAERDRLEAELGGAAAPAAAGQEARLQGALGIERASVLAARRAARAAGIAAIEDAERSERDAGTGLEERLKVAREIEGMRAQLAEDKVGSRLTLLEATSNRLAVEEEARQHLARLAELSSRGRAAVAEREAFLRDWQRETLERLAAVRPQLAQVEEQLAKAERLEALTLLRAPRDGVVLETIRRAPGSLVREGDAVVSLVPSGVPLVAEVTLRSADIGNLAPGTEAILKIDSFPWRRHGTLAGTLRAVSRESYGSGEGSGTGAGTGAGGGGVGLHRGQIAVVPGAALRDLPEGAQPLPGMTLQAELKVGTRSVLDFFLEPLIRGLRESLREP